MEPLLHNKDVSRSIKYCIDNNIDGLYDVSKENYTIADLVRKIHRLIHSSAINFEDIPYEDW